MFDLEICGKKWCIYVCAVQQSGGTIIITYPSRKKYTYKMGFGSVESYYYDLLQIQLIPISGLRDKRLGELANEIKRVARSASPRLKSGACESLAD